MKIFLGADHAGFNVKERLKRSLENNGFTVIDTGTDSMKSVDYPDYAKKVAKQVAKSDAKGILICGSGTGMVIAANKVKGIRAVIAYDNYSAKMSRMDNDANVLCLRGRGITYRKNEQITATWLRTPFSNKARHKRRIAKIRRMER